jgi:hypothetical protein
MFWLSIVLKYIFIGILYSEYKIKNKNKKILRMKNKNQNILLFKESLMRKFKYNDDVTIKFINKRDVESNEEWRTFFKINGVGGKRIIAQNPKTGKYMICMYHEPGQKWRNEKFYLYHELGHWFHHDLTDEASADEYAIEKMGYDVAVQALNDVIIETLNDKTLNNEIKLKAFENLIQRLKVIETLADARGIELHLN